MCTLTVISIRDDTGATIGYRLATNRDESRSRTPARPPERREERGYRAIWPTDPAAGGTWIGSNDFGLTLSILNGNPRPYPELPQADEIQSRGLIIPLLLDAPNAEAATERLTRESAGRHAPFRLVAVDFTAVIDVVWDGSMLTRTGRSLAPACFVSSGLGDHRVAPRLPLFDEMLETLGESTQFQVAFHRHQWPERPEVSVWMERADARTVSITTVEARFDGEAPDVSMTHEQGDTVSTLQLGAAQQTRTAVAGVRTSR